MPEAADALMTSDRDLRVHFLQSSPLSNRLDRLVRSVRPDRKVRQDQLVPLGQRVLKELGEHPALVDFKVRKVIRGRLVLRARRVRLVLPAP